MMTSKRRRRRRESRKRKRREKDRYSRVRDWLRLAHEEGNSPVKIEEDNCLNSRIRYEKRKGESRK